MTDGKWENLIRKTAVIQADAIMVPMNIGREAAEERRDNYHWFFQNDVSPEQAAYEKTLQTKEIEAF